MYYKDTLSKRRSNTEFENLDLLVKAVVASSVSDYENIISGMLKENARCNLEEIARFWREDAAAFTELDMIDVKNKIDTAYDKFCRITKSYGLNIMEETARIRKEKAWKHIDIARKTLTHRCPLCHGGLYARRVKALGTTYTRICCTDCHLSAPVFEKKENH